MGSLRGLPGDLVVFIGLGPGGRVVGTAGAWTILVVATTTNGRSSRFDRFATRRPCGGSYRTMDYPGGPPDDHIRRLHGVNTRTTRRLGLFPGDITVESC